MKDLEPSPVDQSQRGGIALSPVPADLWYAIYVRSRHEKKVSASLMQKGYPILFPFSRVRRRRADRNVDVDVPIFPGYVFAQFDAKKRLPILQIPGVVLIVSQAGEPEPVEAAEIASLARIVDSGRPIQAWDFLRTGQKVRIQGGALAGAEGILIRIKNRERLIVSVGVLQRAISVEIDQDLVEPQY